MIALLLARIRAAFLNPEDRAALEQLSRLSPAERQAELRYRRTLAALERMSDADLLDIGITRGQIDTAARAG